VSHPISAYRIGTHSMRVLRCEESYGAEMDERTAMISQWCVAPRQLLRGPERPREAAAAPH
jgi:hypothetical protein